MQNPIVRKAESALRQIAKPILVAMPTVVLGLFHEQIVSLLPGRTHIELSSWLVWLALSTFLVTSFLLFYVWQYHKTDKALLKIKPDYYVQLQHDKEWNQVTNDRARDKNKP